MAHDMLLPQPVQVAPRLLAFWRFFRAHAAHAVGLLVPAAPRLEHACGLLWCCPAYPCAALSLVLHVEQLHVLMPFSCLAPLQARTALSIRDLLAWAGFIEAVTPSVGLLPAYAHGAHLVLLDGLGLGVGLAPEAIAPLRAACRAYLLSQLPQEMRKLAAVAANGRGSKDGTAMAEDGEGHAEVPGTPMTEDGVDGGQEEGSASGVSPGRWGIAPFYIERLSPPDGAAHLRAAFSFRAPTTARNAMRVLRALQLRKPILLEGSPGVGKTSLVAALAGAVGQVGWARFFLVEVDLLFFC